MLGIKEIWDQFAIPSSEPSKPLPDTELVKTLNICITTSEFTPFHTLLKQHLQIDKIHDSVKEYIESSATKDRLPGPIALNLLAKGYSLDLRHLIPKDPV